MLIALTSNFAWSRSRLFVIYAKTFFNASLLQKLKDTITHFYCAGLLQYYTIQQLQYYTIQQLQYYTTVYTAITMQYLHYTNTRAH